MYESLYDSAHEHSYFHQIYYHDFQDTSTPIEAESFYTDNFSYASHLFLNDQSYYQDSNFFRDNLF